MRSGPELWFRIRQEVINGWMLIHPPRLAASAPNPLPVLPDPEPVMARLRTTPTAAVIESLAEKILSHRIPLLGMELDVGPVIAWRRDCLNGIESDLNYHRRIPILDKQRVGNHKIVSELNRHQHLVLLAQAFLLSGRREFIKEIHEQLESWMDDNPFGRGFNWTSALEAAFRALSWVWVFHWTGSEFPEALQKRFLQTLFLHGCFIERNLSIYFSPNTHLLGEAVTLHLLGRVFPEWPRSEKWRTCGHKLTLEHMQRKVWEDGGYHEQSLHYHVYATDFFLLHKVIAESVSGSYDAQLQRMADLLYAVSICGNSMPAIGDEDGGRLFHPYGNRAGFYRGTLATAAIIYRRPEWIYRPEDIFDIAAWWIGPAVFEITPQSSDPEASKLFPVTGLSVLRAPGVSVVFDVGPFGPGSAAHSHSDTLSITATTRTEEILVDAGTGSYVEEVWRDWFRSTAAHNTVRVDRRDQGRMANAFLWSSKPRVRLTAWQHCCFHDYVDAECCFDGVVHRRALKMIRQGQDVRLFVLDVISGNTGEHVVEQFWHPGAAVQDLGDGRYEIGTGATLILPAAAQTDFCLGGDNGWRSRALEHRQSAPVLKVTWTGMLPAMMAAVVDFGGKDEAVLRVSIDRNLATLRYGVWVVHIPNCAI